MKYFKCGKCSKDYKIDTTNINSDQLVVTCNSCGGKNMIRLGAILIAQSKDGLKQFRLKIGENTIGRKSDSSTCTIQIEDRYVSRNHAKIHVEEKDKKLYFFISDSDSRNGTHNKTKVKIKSNLKYPMTLNDFYIIGLTKLSLKFN